MDGPPSGAARPSPGGIRRRHVEETSSSSTTTAFDDKLDSIAASLSSKRNIIVLVGAGISVSAGIPDFRSANGLYNTLDYRELGLACPEDLFDIEAFVDDPRPFYKFARSLYPGTLSPTPSHRFLSKLDEGHRLLRVYTQNIDALEARAGVSPDRIIYAHGTLSDARCMECGTRYDANDISRDVGMGHVPHCRRPGKGRRRWREDGTRSRESSVAISGTSSCTEEPPASAVAVAVATRQSARLRTSSSSSSSSATTASNRDDDGRTKMDSGMCDGVIKPNVTFFGERLDDRVGRCLRKDSLVADALVVMGTSLSV